MNRTKMASDVVVFLPSVGSKVNEKAIVDFLGFGLVERQL